MIKAIKPESPYCEQVIELCDANRSNLGFLARGAIRDAAEDGHVLAFVDSHQVRGYALYRTRVRTHDVSLTHLCIDEAYRGSGIARKLVEHIVEQHPHSKGIRVLCRKDYSAHHMWPKLGFEHCGEKPGRGHDQLPLVIWWRQISVTLFDAKLDALDSRIVVALDTNIMIDILDQREYDESLALTADWIEEEAELVITNQMHRELFNNHLKSRKREKTLASYRTLNSHPEKEQPILLELHRRGNEHDYQPRVIAGSELRIEPVDSIPSKSRLTSLCYHHVHERPVQLERYLNAIAARRSHRIRQILDADGSLLALSALYCEGEKVFVKVLRSFQSQYRYTLIRQMVHDIRRLAVKDSYKQIIIADNKGVKLAE